MTCEYRVAAQRARARASQSPLTRASVEAVTRPSTCAIRAPRTAQVYMYTRDDTRGARPSRVPAPIIPLSGWRVSPRSTPSCRYAQKCRPVQKLRSGGRVASGGVGRVRPLPSQASTIRSFALTFSSVSKLSWSSGSSRERVASVPLSDVSVFRILRRSRQPDRHRQTAHLARS